MRTWIPRLGARFVDEPGTPAMAVAFFTEGICSLGLRVNSGGRRSIISIAQD
jgi:hypothetical protein